VGVVFGCAVLGLALAGGVVRPAAALPGMSPGTLPQDSPPASGLPAPLREVKFEQKLDSQVPLDAVFHDEAGSSVRLGDLLHGRPAVLLLAYYECPMLCTQTLTGLTGALEALKFDAGREFEVLTISFDPSETHDLARAKKKTYLERYRRPTAEAGWHFLTGDEVPIQSVTEAVGFHAVWDAPASQWAHAAGIVVLTPQGRVSKYFYGVEYPPKDLRLALVEASNGKIGTVVDQLLLFCFHYDPSTGKYGAAVVNIVRAGGVLTLLALGTFVGLSHRRERARRTATVGG
jgi:protein SCO1